MKWTTAVQIFTYAKLLAMFIIIATGMVQLGRDNTEYIRFCMMVVVYLQQGLEKDIINNWNGPGFPGQLGTVPEFNQLSSQGQFPDSDEICKECHYSCIPIKEDYDAKHVTIEVPPDDPPTITEVTKWAMELNQSCPNLPLSSISAQLDQGYIIQVSQFKNFEIHANESLFF